MKSLKIDIICNDGSPIGIGFKDVYGDNGRIGLGGAELALMTLCEAWHEAGHTIRLYNNPRQANLSEFQQYPIDTFLPQEYRDILIIFRSPNHRIRQAKGKKIWLSCDQYTVGDFRDFANQVDSIVTISEFHAEHFKNSYGINNTHIIDLPVRLNDYTEKIEKIPHKMIFCSVPDRGLELLTRIYPRIKAQIPDASLVITSDYRLWGVFEPRNEQYIRRFIGMDGVQFMGAIPRRDLIREQLSSEIQAYPCIYDELFCYSVAECQVSGTLPVTSTFGALSTTNMGIQVQGDPRSSNWADGYADVIIETLKDRNLNSMQDDVRKRAIERFSISRILKEWDKVFSG